MNVEVDVQNLETHVCIESWRGELDNSVASIGWGRHYWLAVRNGRLKIEEANRQEEGAA
jgi:hypothetical protein